MVLTGLDRWIRLPPRTLRRARAGLLCHQASVTRALEPAPQALRRAGLRLTALFAPEHGLAGALQDQVEVRPARASGLPVHSLYGNPKNPAEKRRLAPSPASLEGLDVLVIDLQDVGVRYYTFVWTMALAMEACARAGKPVFVLDRPNPLGGEILEGNLQDPDHLSFVGLYPVPVRHGLTIGEMASHVNSAFGIGADLTVIPMTGWRRRMRHEDTGLPWVPPSPNMPTPDTAAVYAGMCLLEGTNLSEGRGTTRPFEIVGAPFLDPDGLARDMNRLQVPGAVFRPCSFRPAFHKWTGRLCGGVQVHVTDPRRYPSFLAGLLLLRTALRHAPARFRWRPPPYEYETEKPAIDLLCGGPRMRRDLEAGRDPREISKTWESDLADFRRRSAPHRLYH